MDPWVKVTILSLGGVLGVNARYWLSGWMNRWVSAEFPWATFTINVTGSFAIGLLGILLTRWIPGPNARLFLVVGFLGGYTTFSTFALESYSMWERNETLTSAAYMISSVLAGFVAVAVGIGLAQAVAGPVGESSFEAKQAHASVVQEEWHRKNEH